MLKKFNENSYKRDSKQCWESKPTVSWCFRAKNMEMLFFSFYEDLDWVFHRSVTVVLCFSVNCKQETSKALVKKRTMGNEEMCTDPQNYWECLKLCTVSNCKEDFLEQYSVENNRSIALIPSSKMDRIWKYKKKLGGGYIWEAAAAHNVVETNRRKRVFWDVVMKQGDSVLQKCVYCMQSFWKYCQYCSLCALLNANRYQRELIFAS